MIKVDQSSTPCHPRSIRVLIASGFFESSLVSFREYAYSRGLAALGHQVTLMCGDQSYVWAHGRVKLPVTNPAEKDAAFVAQTGVRLLRRSVFVRVSDFALYVPSIAAIKNADIVHVIEFRHGVTLLVALLARLMGKPVVYDHEQRGDRSERWYSRIDSRFRRSLISLGSVLVDCVRHTVLANRDHYRSCSLTQVETMFAPLGVDTALFFFDENERTALRRRLRIAPNERLAIMTGKLHHLKRVPDVVLACRRAGIRLVLVGPLSPNVDHEIKGLGPGTEIMLAQTNPEDLRALYNAADYGIFTTFTVSYWEAHATGLHLLVPATEFTEIVFGNDLSVTPYGDSQMFIIPDEQYHPEVDLAEMIEIALRCSRPAADRASRTDFSSSVTVQRLSELYYRLLRGGPWGQVRHDEAQPSPYPCKSFGERT